MEELSTEAINLLRQNARSLVRELGLLNDAYFEIGVTLAERHLLIELTSCTGPTFGEIAERLLLDKSTASRLIAKAMKKGYVKCSSDKKDKRKRFLHMTELGKKTLNAFEPIAFNQTKEALQTLTSDEIQTVYRGIALYAKGLKNSRTQKRDPKKDYPLKPFSKEDEGALYEIFREVIDAGGQFHYASNSMQEFHRQFFHPGSNVYVCHSSNGEVIGGFYIRANHSEKSDLVANAAYMIKSTHRGQGIGTHLVQTSLQMAQELGFQAMQFNKVLGTNVRAIKLYQKLGFTIVGGSHQEGYIMHRKLQGCL